MLKKNAVLLSMYISAPIIDLEAHNYLASWFFSRSLAFDALWGSF